MSSISHIWRKFMISFANIFRGTHFFQLKRYLLNLASGIEIGKNSKVVGPFWAGSVSSIKIGENCFINRDFNVEGNGTLNIGDNVDIGPNVRILTGGHEIGEPSHRAGNGITYSIKVGNGVWIGASSIFLGNTNIENGCVIGAGTLVNKSFSENILVVGHPGIAKKKLYNK